MSANPWNEGENGDIYLLSAGASPREFIGRDGDGVAHACPTFSSDGQRLAYGEARASGSVAESRGVWPVSNRAVVVVALASPSKPVVRVTLPSSPGEIVCPKWSPDGRHLAFRLGAGLWVADSTTGKANVFQVGATPWGQQGFAWSRDGSRIAVAEPGSIRVVPIDGSTPAVIHVTGSIPGGDSGSIGWTAGDDAIVYTGADPQGNYLAIDRIDADGANDTQLAIGGDSVVSPDGTRVAYVSNQYSAPDNDQHVMIMSTRGGKGVEVAVPPTFVLEALLWSPDGKRLLLSSIDGVISVAVAPGSAPIVYATGYYNHPGAGLYLEWSYEQVTWQP